MALSFSNFLGDPFAITTVSFGVISWIIALAGAAASPQSLFPHFSWWGIVYQILIILIIFFLYLNNTIELYKFTLVGLLSIAFIYSSNSVNNLVYTSQYPGYQCCAAGCILLSMLNIVWIMYFGGHPESPTNQFIDSFALRSHSHTQGHLAYNDPQKLETMDRDGDDYKAFAPVNLPVSHSNQQLQEGNLRQSQLTMNNKSGTTPYMSSSQLNGLENFSPSDMNQKDANKRLTVYNDVTSNLNMDMTYKYKAKALYSYDANPDDINEISFVKDEILEVDDIDGKWWQARRANGQVGICPSNYVKLLD